MSLTLKGKCLRVKVGSFKKSRLASYAKNANFENGGSTFDIDSMRVLLNILSIS